MNNNQLALSVLRIQRDWLRQCLEEGEDEDIVQQRNHIIFLSNEANTLRRVILDETDDEMRNVLQHTLNNTRCQIQNNLTELAGLQYEYCVENTPEFDST